MVKNNISLLTGTIKKNNLLIEDRKTKLDTLKTSIKETDRYADKMVYRLRMLAVFDVVLLLFNASQILNLFGLGYNELKGWHFFLALVFEYFVLLGMSIFIGKEVTLKDAHFFMLKRIIKTIDSERDKLYSNKCRLLNVSTENVSALENQIKELEAENAQMNSRICNPP